MNLITNLAEKIVSKETYTKKKVYETQSQTKKHGIGSLEQSGRLGGACGCRAWRRRSTCWRRGRPTASLTTALR